MKRHYDLIVTRHKGLVDYLRNEGIVDSGVDVIEHAEPKNVRGLDTIGVLPLRLAAKAVSHTEVSLDFPEDYRGEELDENEVREYATEIVEYDVSTEEVTDV